MAIALGDGVLRLEGSFRLRDAGGLWHELRKETDALKLKEKELAIDLSKVEAIDGGVMSLLVALRAELASRGVKSAIVATPKQFEPLVELYQANGPPMRASSHEPEGFIVHVGREAIATASELRAVVSFFGEMALAAVGIVRRPRSGHWREVMPLVERTGADAIPIVVLINFLVGFVLAYQAARQLKMFGANLYVADLVGLSVTRELAPLMTAIIVCGRSGAAFAAEIGSMKVSDEVDALRTLGLRPFSWLVVPRVIALLLVVPALTLVADVLGLIGGLAVAVTSLDLSAHGYLNESKKAMELWDFEHGLIKSVAFALAIGLIACQQGFAASGGAEGVGRRTTSSVVVSLFVLVVLDALFTTAFRVFGK